MQRDEYIGHVLYRVWKWGGNPDLVNAEAAAAARANGMSADNYAHYVVCQQRRYGRHERQRREP